MQVIVNIAVPDFKMNTRKFKCFSSFLNLEKFQIITIYYYVKKQIAPGQAKNLKSSVSDYTIFMIYNDLNL